MKIDMVGSTAGIPAGNGVDGVRNFRDAGGLGALPSGVLYRSGALHTLSERGARELAGLGVRTVVDLRSGPETADRPDVLHGIPLTHLHVPVFAEQRWPDEQTALYPAMAEHAGRAVLAVLRRLAAGDGAPVLVHCASGKDRTGVVVALVQTLFGAPEAAVTEDFLRSNEALGLCEPPPSSPAPRGHNTRPVAAAHLARALLWIRSHHGSLPAYLRTRGATEQDLAALPAGTPGI
ncbi:tyrosine-protein phosphatase [Streptomyces termitum]|uniref:tyrosine-protein phosphatase n=1 Tax=Streptomyces termitum TaxID=67368 RepID=UPI0033B1A49D